MKLQYLMLLLSVLFLGCQKNEDGKVYPSRSLTTNEDFNQFEKGNEKSLTVDKYEDKNEEGAAQANEAFGIKFKDTTVRIQNVLSEKGEPVSRFSVAEFLNTQKTALLVQAADSTGLVAPFYLVSLKNGQLDVVRIYRSSKGKEDNRFTKGLSRIGRSGYLINNDYFITTVNAKVYPLTRQNPDERIQGLHFMNSTDKKTLVFLVSSSLYQVNYPTGEAFTQPLGAKVPQRPAELFQWIQQNYTWQTNANGVSFLKSNKDDNRVIDISEFKKS